MNQQGQADLMWVVAWLVLTVLTGVFGLCLGGDGAWFGIGFIGWAVVMAVVRAILEDYYS
jgi:hypothetical protein